MVGGTHGHRLAPGQTAHPRGIPQGNGHHRLIFLAIYAVIFVIWYKLLYFIPLFMARPFNLEESWNYNLHLSKGNKLRIIIPSIIFLGLIFLIYFPLGINIFLFRSSSFSDYLIFNLISSFIHTFLIIMFIIMNCIIYLNVE